MCRWVASNRLSFACRQEFHLSVFEALLDALHFVLKLVQFALHTLAGEPLSVRPTYYSATVNGLANELHYLGASHHANGSLFGG